MLSCTSTDSTGTDEAIAAELRGCLCHGPALRSVARRIGADLTRRGFVAGTTASVASLVAPVGLPRPAIAQPAASRPARPILFTNVRPLDGKDPVLRDGRRLLIEGNRIKGIAQDNPGPPTARPSSMAAAGS